MVSNFHDTLHQGTRVENFFIANYIWTAWARVVCGSLVIIIYIRNMNFKFKWYFMQSEVRCIHFNVPAKLSWGVLFCNITVSVYFSFLLYYILSHIQLKKKKSVDKTLQNWVRGKINLQVDRNIASLWGLLFFSHLIASGGWRRSGTWSFSSLALFSSRYAPTRMNFLFVFFFLSFSLQSLFPGSARVDLKLPKHKGALKHSTFFFPLYEHDGSQKVCVWKLETMFSVAWLYATFPTCTNSQHT